MKRVGDARGFTIVETIIFLTVSSALFVSAMLMVSGQQAKAEFHQAVGEAQAIVDDVTNDVATGYFQRPETSSVCVRGADSTPWLWGSQVEAGKSPKCMILGHVIQFDTAGSLTTYSIVGFREAGGSLATDLTTSGATATLINNTNFITTNTLPGGLTVAGAVAEGDDGPYAVQGVAFVASLGSFADGKLGSGSMAVDVIPLTGSRVASRASSFFTDTNTQLRTAPAPVTKNASKGVTVCLDSGGTNQHVLLKFGAGGNLTTSITYATGKSAADGRCHV